MSTRAFAKLERDRLADEDYAEAVRIERLAAAGKLCADCFAIDGIERDDAATYHCTHCGKRWAS
jgi:hypothetical protein